MKLLLSILCGVALASCAGTKAPLTTPIPSAPPRAVPVAPEASRLRDQIADAGKMVIAIDAGAKEASKAATAAREEAERLKVQKSATEAELTKLWQDLQSLEARNLFLETQAQRLTANLTDARETAAILQQTAAAKDAEAEILQRQYEHVSLVAADYAKQIATAHTEAASQRTRADKLAGEVRIWRIVCWGSLALCAFAMLARLFLPPRLIR